MSDKLPMDPVTLSISILVAERDGLRRTNEPVTVGIPFPRGVGYSPSELRLLDQDGNLHACQMQVLARWFDDSIKWMLVDFQADVEPAAKAKYLLRRSDTPIAVTQPRGINVTESPTLSRSIPGETFLSLMPAF